MSEQRREMPLQEVEVGMVLAADVVDNRGSVLVSAGVELGEKLLRVLEARGIEQVVVTETALSEGERQTREQRILTKLEHQYAGFGDDPTMMSLQSMFKRYHLRGMR